VSATPTFPDYTGKACPKCGYVRPPGATNPAWQCPQCGIAYNKFSARVAAHGRVLAGKTVTDDSAWSLLAANALAAGIAWGVHMSLRELMLVYWMQSVIIGLSYFLRMLGLHEFTTEGTTMNGRPIPETAGGKRMVALFFAFHYGFFHFVYLMFLVSGKGAASVAGSRLALALCALGFLVNHAYSLARNLEADRAGRPNLGTMMFLPYARILPMHFTIILGGLLHGGAGIWWLFAALKTGADVLMHAVEHHVLANSDK
jgi:Family of unknown function (DUF6498)